MDHQAIGAIHSKIDQSAKIEESNMRPGFVAVTGGRNPARRLKADPLEKSAGDSQQGEEANPPIIQCVVDPHDQHRGARQWCNRRAAAVRGKVIREDRLVRSQEGLSCVRRDFERQHADNHSQSQDPWPFKFLVTHHFTSSLFQERVKPEQYRRQ